MKLYLYSSFFLLCFSNCLRAQVLQKDSLLPIVTTTINKAYNETTSSFPLQKLSQLEIKQTGSLSVGDAVKYFSGVIVKDYGGIGGLKTVSVRSLGANHVNVMYDGIVMNPGQGGQIDLSKISVNNIYSISLQNAQPSEILNPAKAFSSAALLVLETNNSSVESFQKSSYNIGFKAGSYAFFNPVANTLIKLNNRWALNASADILQTKGNYAFVDALNGNIKRRRENSDVASAIAEANLLYRDSTKTIFDLKAYYYGSKRGLPGAIIYQNFHTDERLNNRDFFVQGRLKKQVTNKLDLLLNTRFSSLYSFYLDPGIPTVRNDYDNIFTQNEYYISAASKYKFSKNYYASYAVDFFYTKLLRTDSFATRQLFPWPDRNTLLNNLAFKVQYNRVEIQLSILHTHIQNQVKVGNAGAQLNKLSPTFSIVVQPKQDVPLRLRAFYKNIFRAPTFDDLYYTNIGNTKLKPEQVKQYNVGFTYSIKHYTLLRKLQLTVDAYHNNVKDKIVAIPRDNLFQWSMQNLGKVKINGIDATLEAATDIIKKWQLQTNIAYTYQNAIDVTDPASVVYKNQIPYTPKHSGSARLALTDNKFSIAYNLLASSYRYNSGEITRDNYLSGWLMHGFALSYEKPMNNVVINLFGEVNNIFNKQYEIVMNYPMPGFNYRAGFNIHFN